MFTAQPIETCARPKAHTSAKNRVGDFSMMLEIRIDKTATQPAQLHRVTWVESARPASDRTKATNSGDGKFSNAAATDTYKSTIEHIQNSLKNNPGKPVSLTQGQLSALMNMDMQDAKDAGFDKMGLKEFLDTIKGGGGDGTMFAFAGNKFSVTNSKGEAQIFKGSDINYYYQGLAAAARGGIGARAGMNARIGAWNVGEYLIGDDLNWGRNQFDSGQLQQISPAQNWANQGFDFYQENK